MKNKPKTLGKRFGPPPKKGPNSQGITVALIRIGALSDIGNFGCPHRENGVQGSDIKGVKPIQVKGKGFTGIK